MNINVPKPKLHKLSHLRFIERTLGRNIHGGLAAPRWGEVEGISMAAPPATNPPPASMSGSLAGGLVAPQTPDRQDQNRPLTQTAPLPITCTHRFGCPPPYLPERSSTPNQSIRTYRGNVTGILTELLPTNPPALHRANITCAKPKVPL